MRKKVLWSSGLGLLALGLGLVLPWATTYAAPVRAYVAGNFMLSLNGANAGGLKSVEGGTAYADVVQESQGPSSFLGKHLGQPRYEDITIRVAPSLSPPLASAIADSWLNKAQRLNGAITAYDTSMNAQSSREFVNALISETTIPACDGASKEPGYLTIKLAPELTRSGKAAGKAATAGKAADKAWIPANFKLELDGLDCTRVSKVDAFTVKTPISSDRVGKERNYEKTPSAPEFGSLSVTMSAAQADSWQRWHEDSVIKGNATEKNGTLTLLAPNRTDALLTIKLFNVGIYALRSPKPDANAESIARLEAGLYVERMELVAGK
jgi:hypothetical protein